MWLSSKIFSILEVAKDSVDSLRAENAALRVERDLLKLQLANSQNHFDWLRIRVNSLETERGQLIEKAYGIRIPVPEIAKTQNAVRPELTPDIFNDMGDDLAKEFGLPVYNS